MKTLKQLREERKLPQFELASKVNGLPKQPPERSVL